MVHITATATAVDVVAVIAVGGVGSGILYLRKGSGPQNIILSHNIIAFVNNQYHF